MKPNARIGWIPALIGFVLFAPIVSGQDKPLKKINWGVTSLSAGNWIPWIAKEAKIYEKHGLDVELILLRGSGQTSSAMLGGSIFASPVALPTVMLADLSGADLINVAHTVPGVQTKMLVKPEIKRPEDLRGKRVATSSLGSLGDFLFKYMLRKHGLDPEPRNGLAVYRYTAGTASGACSPARSTPPRFLIPSTCRRNAKAIESCSTREKRWFIPRCRWSRGVKASSRTETP